MEQYLRGKLARNPVNELVSVATAAASAPVQIDVTVTATNAANGTNGTNGTNGAHETNGTNGANGHVSVVPEGDAPVLVQVANAKREAERVAILEALRATNWNRRKASVQLQTDYKGLLYKMKVLSIKKEYAASGNSRDSFAMTMTTGSKPS